MIVKQGFGVLGWW